MSESATEIELVPRQEQVSEQAFRNAWSKTQFWQRLLKAAEKGLEEIAAARRASEEAAKRRHIC